MPTDIDDIRSVCERRRHSRARRRGLRVGRVYKGRAVGAHSRTGRDGRFTRARSSRRAKAGCCLMSGTRERCRARPAATRTRRDRKRVGASSRTASPRRAAIQRSATTSGCRTSQAAIGLVQLGRLDEIVTRRREPGSELSASCSAMYAGLTMARDPEYGDDQLPVVLGAVAGGFPCRSRRAARRDACHGHLVPDRDHGQSSRRQASTISLAHGSPTPSGCRRSQ